MRLLRAELHKIWGQRIFALCLAMLVAANLLLLYLGTMPSKCNAPAGAYRAIAKDLAAMDTMEQKTFLQRQYDTIHGVYQVQTILSKQAQGWYSDWDIRKEFADVFVPYEEIYKKHDYTLYTNSLQTENFFLKELVDEVNMVASYTDFLEELQTKAKRLTGISIFQNNQSDTKSYSQANIEKTAQVYVGMENVKIRYSPQKGLFTALDYQFTDLILLAAMILLSSLLVRQERDSGMIHVVRSTPGGRLRTVLAKIGAMALSLLVILALLYGVNLVYCSFTFGLGPLTRSIQSVPALMRCTMQITVAEYLGRFLMAKWVGTVVTGLWVMLAMLWARRTLTGWCTALALPGIEWLIRTIIPASSNLNVIKYANIASLMRTNELLGNYRNLYWFGTPVSLPVVEWLSAMFYNILLIGLVCLLFCHGKMQPTPVFAGFSHKQKKTRATTIFRQECRKLFILGGAAIILLTFTGYEIIQTIRADRAITSVEVHYQNYMRELEGRYTQKTYDHLLEIQQQFVPLVQLWEASSHNEKFEMDDETIRYDILTDQYEAFQKIMYDDLSYIAEKPGAQLVYKAGWQKLFGWKENDDLQDALWAGLLSCVCFAGLFAFEKKGGMQRVVMATPLGRRDTVRQKLWAGTIGAGLVCALTYLPRVIFVNRFYWLGQPLAPAFSFPEFQHLPQWLSLSGVMLWSMSGRFVACLSMMLIMFWLSNRLESALSAVFVGSLLFCLPPMLSMSGLTFMKWVGVYPLFHLAKMLCHPFDTFGSLLCMIIAGSICILCGVDLYDQWEG